ncbi:hypothetical protein GOP47_0015021 [Adiantum capillus-veneris]|uniref:Uncharacterized protein n=1 Tax=Adiantum capillus-veneris TaxID=13818 RepID=A0A9D4UMK2_ADICA|nr:hypothetical protein GOP47_0015021 [Adiantum capillus-veneris]
MGTAVLLPQDFLRPRSRLKNQSSGMIYPVESAPRSKRNRSTSSAPSLKTGLLPLPHHAQHSSPMSIPQRGIDVKHIKARKDFGLNDTSPSTATPDPSQRRILQRPQQDSAIELLAHFAIVDKPGPLLGEVKGSKVEAAEGVEGCAHITAGHDGGVGVQMDAFKMKQKQSKTRKEKLSSGFSSAKPIMAKMVGRNSTILTRQLVEEQDKLLLKGLAQLRRTTTEPPPPMAKHMVDQYTRSIIQISLSNPKLEAYACSHQFCGSGGDVSCKERWAGPAYSSSPPPSSLPLPKLCLPHPKLATVKLPSLIKQHSAGVYTQSLSETAAPPFGASEMGGTWDTAFATNSLRRLLNLDSH